MPVTIKGLDALAKAVDRLPSAVTEALKQEAHASADRLAEAAKANLRSKTHGSGKLADSIEVLDKSDEKKFTVNVPGGEGEDPMLGVYLEYGTKKMDARPFLRPARDAEEARYLRNMAAVATKAIKDLLG
jgi:HK97 gp10 family phage protein